MPDATLLRAAVASMANLCLGTTALAAFFGGTTLLALYPQHGPRIRRLLLRPAHALVVLCLPCGLGQALHALGAGWPASTISALLVLWATGSWILPGFRRLAEREPSSAPPALATPQRAGVSVTDLPSPQGILP